MSVRWKWIISFGLLVSLIGLQLLISKKQLNSDAESSPSQNQPNSSNPMVQSLSGVHIVENNGPKQVWELWASKGVLDSQNTWKVQDLKVHFFADNGMVYEVTAPEGVVESDKKNDVLKLKLYKEVITKSSSGYTFYSKEAKYLKQEHELFFPGYIKMTGPVKNSKDIILTGRDMNIYLSTNEIKIHYDIFASHKGSSEKITLNSNSALLNGQTKIAKFMGGVKVNMTEYSIVSEKAEFHFNKKDLISGEFSENLEATVEDKKVTAQRLFIDFIDRTFTFKGNGVFQSDTDTLSGDEIIVSNEGRRIQVSNAKALLNPQSKPKPLRKPKID